MISLLKLSEIKRTTEMQPRTTMQMAVAEDYAEDIKAGAKFPPLIVFRVDGEHILVDGFHRALALQSAGMKKAQCEVLEGTMRDAFLYASGVNAGHGLRRTNEDKRRAVERLLHDPEWSQWSDNKIADICKVDPKTVAKFRENSMEIHRDPEAEPSKVRMFATKKGTVSKINTGNIGKKPAVDVDALIEAIEDPAVRQKTIEYRAGCIGRGEQVYANDIREYIKMHTNPAATVKESLPVAPVTLGERLQTGNNTVAPAVSSDLNAIITDSSGKVSANTDKHVHPGPAGINPVIINDTFRESPGRVSCVQPAGAPYRESAFKTGSQVKAGIAGEMFPHIVDANKMVSPPKVSPEEQKKIEKQRRIDIADQLVEAIGRDMPDMVRDILKEHPSWNTADVLYFGVQVLHERKGRV